MAYASIDTILVTCGTTPVDSTTLIFGGVNGKDLENQK
jgi:hypothetical protein